MGPVRAQVGDLRPIYQIMRRINGGADVHSVLDAVVEGVAQAVGFEVAAISYLTRDLTFHVAAVSGSAEAREQLLGMEVPLSSMEDELTVADQWGSLLFIPAGRLGDVSTGWLPAAESGASAPLDPERWRPEDTLRSPLRSPEGELLGLLSVDVPVDGRRPDQSRRELLEMYSDLAGIALHNARRATELEEQVRLAGAVEAIHSNATRSLEVTHIVESSVQPIAEALGADNLWLRAFADGERLSGTGARYPDSMAAGSDALLGLVTRTAKEAWARRRVSLVRIEGGGARIGATEHATEPVVTERTTAPAGPSLDAQDRTQVADGRAGWVPRRPLREDPEDPQQHVLVEYVRPLDAQTILLAPLGAGNDCLGYLVLLRRTGGPEFSPYEVQAAGQIARNLGQAVLNARLLEREHVLVGQLEALDHYKSDLISTVSHELRTPLTAITGHLELIEDDPASAPSNSFRVIGRNLERVMALIDDLLTLKKLTDTDTTTAAGVVDLHQAALDAVSAFRPTATDKGIALALTPHAGPLLISGDRDELERVALNLVGNAVKYTPPGGAVTVTTARTERFVRLVVQDTGYGISLRDQEELFTEFFRSTNPDALALPGTGLGLSIVRRIVQRHGGSILLDSHLGRGSTFTVRLPLSRTTA
ncbi:ATP-binding protein [Nocardioides sp. cx-173]|uniref:sensor histidine kinase n=1 Tax=Nocardioides sp. cx-173 TaxID=2898796 RepID=UPI001E5F0654|nr:ATP-binding protein [Nocardioides sp. cx-173]MCD4527379.1 ATP-binding protein [Nocardioides sp. cx-173]UGB42421.1 ATP-binding protein [Nocardioides sp. cx-173]